MADYRWPELLAHVAVTLSTQQCYELARHQAPELFVSQSEIVSANGPQLLPCQLGTVTVF